MRRSIQEGQTGKKRFIRHPQEESGMVIDGKSFQRLTLIWKRERGRMSAPYPSIQSNDETCSWKRASASAGNRKEARGRRGVV